LNGYYSGAMKLLAILLTSASLLAVSCERHEFEGKDGTKQLHEHHASGGHAADHAPAHHADKSAH
jgi:hypothetical protein